jgi:Ras-related protein Rab-7A
MVIKNLFLKKLYIACILVYDVNNKKSFENIGNWKKEFLKQTNPDENFPFVIIGNKIDLEQREVSIEDSLDWCKKNGDLKLFETSCKDDINIDQIFDYIGRNACTEDDYKYGDLSISYIDIKKNKSCCI